MTRPAGSFWYAFSTEGFKQSIAESKIQAIENLKNNYIPANAGMPNWFFRPAVKFTNQEFHSVKAIVNPLRYMEHHCFAKIIQLYTITILYAPIKEEHGIILVLVPKLKTSNHLQFYYAQSNSVRLSIDMCIERMHLHYLFQIDLKSFMDYHQDGKKTVWLLNFINKLPRASFDSIIHLEE